MNILQKLIIRVSVNLIKHCLQSEPIHAFIYMYIYTHDVCESTYFRGNYTKKNTKPNEICQ